MKIAIEGCCHGELDAIYAAIAHLEKVESLKIDLLICCGDFQAVRNLDDLECMSVPDKYKELGTFYKYYSGEKTAPIPTLFIGGNHEASNYLWELYYGGYVAPNIYYVGHSGVVKFGDLRIGGLSGIYKSHDYKKGHHERPPYLGHAVKTAYHVREFDVFKLKQVKEDIDVFLSHDWPRGIAHFGNKRELYRKKKFLKDEIETNTLGSPPAEDLLKRLRPRYWFSAHLHVKYAALVKHEDGKTTKFLALDKCLPHRDFLQVIDLPEKSPGGGFALDAEWLSILKANHEYHSVTHQPARLPGYGTPEAVDLDLHRKWISARLGSNGESSTAPPEFVATRPAHDPTMETRRRGRAPDVVDVNPQTQALMDLLELDVKMNAPNSGSTGNADVQYYSVPRPGPFGATLPPRRVPPPPPKLADENEIEL
jgi:lariat debranching enzyme